MYKHANAIVKLKTKDRESILFTVRTVVLTKPKCVTNIKVKPKMRFRNIISVVAISNFKHIKTRFGTYLYIIDIHRPKRLNGQ